MILTQWCHPCLLCFALTYCFFWSCTCVCWLHSPLYWTLYDTLLDGRSHLTNFYYRYLYLPVLLQLGAVWGWVLEMRISSKVYFFVVVAVIVMVIVCSLFQLVELPELEIIVSVAVEMVASVLLLVDTVGVLVVVQAVQIFFVPVLVLSFCWMQSDYL